MLSSEILGLCRNSIIGIATRYGLDDVEIESRYGQDFSHPSISALGVQPNSCIMGTGSLPCSKVAGVEVYLFVGVGWSTSQLDLCGVSRVNFPFFITFRRNLPPRP